jgi:hypothetical protein
VRRLALPQDASYLIGDSAGRDKAWRCPYRRRTSFELCSTKSTPVIGKVNVGTLELEAVRERVNRACTEQFATRRSNVLSGKSVADIGTGSGILALAAARAGATNVLALDINPNAARSARENAQAKANV